MPAVGSLVSQLRLIEAGTLTATVRLYTKVETHGPGSRPVITWEPGRKMPGKLIPATAGGTNIRADQPTPLGDAVLELEEDAVMEAGQRATVEGEDRLQQPWRRAVLIKKVYDPTPMATSRRALVSEIADWWPT
jgi:hypothetical protein